MMHAPVGMRRGFEPRDEATHFVMSDFALGHDHAMLLQGGGGGRSKTRLAGFPASSGPAPQGGGVAELVSSSYGRGSFCAQSHKNHAAVPMGSEAGLFYADAYAGIGNASDIIRSPENSAVRTQDERRNRGSGMFLFDWPELGPLELEDFETDHLGFDDATGLQLTINLANNPLNAQQPSKNKGRETPLDSSSSEETEHFPRLSETSLLFCPFDDMLVPTPSSIASSSTVSGPADLVPRCSAKAATPDMILDEMAENPLEMYFPPLKTYEQPLVPMSSTQMHHQLLPEGYFAAGDGAALNSSGLEFGPRGRRAPGGGGGSRENPRSPSVVKAAPVKQAGFQKLQEGMNQLDVGAKTCIRDALYRLANTVERRHCVDQTVGSSDAANRFKKSSVWTEAQGSPMDRSVAQLLLQKPMYQKPTDRQANRVA